MVTLSKRIHGIELQHRMTPPHHCSVSSSGYIMTSVCVVTYLAPAYSLTLPLQLKYKIDDFREHSRPLSSFQFNEEILSMYQTIEVSTYLVHIVIT